MVYVRRRPAVLVLFLLAGVVTALVDAVRVAGLVPTSGQTAVNRGPLRVVLHVIPSPVSPVGTPPGAWLGLELPWLAVAGGLELLGTVCGVAAAVWVLRRVADTPRGGDTAVSTWGVTARLLAYHLAIAGVLSGGGLLVSGNLELLGIPVVLFLLYVAARTFLVPARGGAGGGVLASLE